MALNDSKILKIVNSFENGLLVLILSVMIILAVFQIFSRNILSEGVVWIDPLLRTLVLWIGLTGAIVASRANNHIKIDVFFKYFPEKIQIHISRLSYCLTFILCLIISWHAARFVYSEYEYGSTAFAMVPTWVTATIIPISFFLIAIRYVVLLLTCSQVKPINGNKD